jgi:hypothetical protein
MPSFLLSLHKQCKPVILYTTTLLCFPKNLIPWRDSNPGLLVPEADAMSTAPRHQGYKFGVCFPPKLVTLEAEKWQWLHLHQSLVEHRCRFRTRKPNQCDQIGRNFTILRIFQKVNCTRNIFWYIRIQFTALWENKQFTALWENNVLMDIVLKLVILSLLLAIITIA